MNESSDYSDESVFEADLYELLGVGHDATEREIKRLYRLLSKRFHPDLNPNDGEAEERFKKIQWAYEQLRDPTRASPSGEADSPGKTAFDPSVKFSHPFYGFFEALRAYSAAMKPRNEDQ